MSESVCPMATYGLSEESGTQKRSLSCPLFQGKPMP